MKPKPGSLSNKIDKPLSRLGKKNNKHSNNWNKK